jgi:outer membrane protein
MQADLRLSAGLLRQRWFSAGAFLQATSASAKSSNAMYGVTEAQSLKSGLDAFRASGGWLSTSAGLLASAELHPHWVVVGSVELRRLASSVSHSPLVERRSNRYLSAGLAYRY